VTPGLSGCGIAGVQRERVFEAASRLGIACSVETISRARVCDSSQVLLVNSVIGLWWVSALDERRWQRCEHTAVLSQCLESLGD
jgi:4-amino-4-deoxychorismate lyase